MDADRNMLMSQAPEHVRIHAKEQSIYTARIYPNSVEHNQPRRRAARARPGAGA